MNDNLTKIEKVLSNIFLYHKLFFDIFYLN